MNRREDAGPDHIITGLVRFNCDECGRRIVALGEVQKMDLCAACLTLPGWFRYPEVRRAIDPEHDGLEVCERPTAI